MLGADLNPLLLVKRPVAFVLFAIAAFLAALLQLDARFTCLLMKALAPVHRATILAIAALAVVFAVTLIAILFLSRYLTRREAIAAAFLHYAAFAGAAVAGAALRLVIAPAAECASMTPFESAERWPAIFLVISISAPLFAGTLNLIPHKADYSELGERMRAYLGMLRKEPLDLAAITAALQKALDAAESARAADPSARYRHAVSERVIEPLRLLLNEAKGTPRGHPEEFLRTIGHRDHSLAPAEAVAAASRAQRELERAWPPPQGPR